MRPMVEKRPTLVAALWIVWLVFIPARTRAQTPSPPLPAGVAIQIKAVPEIATVGDPIRIRLDVTAPEEYRVQIPRPEKQMGDFAILDFSSGPVEPDPQKSADRTLPPAQQTGRPRHYRAHILAAVYQTGKFTFPPVRLELSTGAGGAMAVFSPPAPVEIQSVLDEKNPNLKDLKKQAEIPEPARWGRWLAIAAAGILLLAIVLLLRRRKKTHSVPLSPEQAQNGMKLAEAELNDLLARGLPDGGNEKRFYVLLSSIVRKILEIGFEIRTAERTTLEIMGALCSGAKIDPGKSALVESFLQRCDAVKFAKYIPSRTEHESAARDALWILEEAKKAVEHRQSAVGRGAPAVSG